ncbi:MAG TPA: hydantoinase/oxoprolinase family protein [Beijerinckiaceae bacterium]|nr:hydantoinase/oxoprolinase family protein [Beijerinckiaceae bacterium]
MKAARLAVDIGGTFTDFAIENGGRRWTHKLLTTSRAPEIAVLEGTKQILADAGLRAADLSTVIHGTTLATNAVIERKGAKTALLVTEGFRDSVEMAYENRFEQYDIWMERPPPLVPRNLRLPVPERLSARGEIIKPLDESAFPDLVRTLEAAAIESVAIGFLHSYVDPVHEHKARDILARLAPRLSLTLSSEVSPEMREYERWSTACVNAYVQPIMASYLARLEEGLRAQGVACPLYLMTSAGGLTTMDMARRFPVRLVESGPAGGAVLARHIAEECGFRDIVSFDMGGTTAKICLIDDLKPQYSRSFEVARQYRFMKGSGLPIRIPVVEMVEIGAGGGSIAEVDALSRIQVGPESAGSEPGPASYGRGGTQPTVTDADLVLGRIQAERFAAGRMRLDAAAAERAIDAHVGQALKLDSRGAALGIAEVVEENMANAARIHAVERGKDLPGREMVAFGGAAPLHAARLAEKLDVRTILIPTGAGVGSAVGFLLAAVGYEIVRTRYALLDGSFEAGPLGELRKSMREEAEAVVRQGEPSAELTEFWTADMRYRGQGHELAVTIPGETTIAPASLKTLFEREYAAQFGRVIPGLDVEVLNWTLRLSAPEPPVQSCPPSPPDRRVQSNAVAQIVDPATGQPTSAEIHPRANLRAGDLICGPALIVEDETTTFVAANYQARINGLGYIVLTRS